jgi:hypothetical protein
MGCATSIDGHTFFSGRGIEGCSFCGVVADFLCDFPLGGGATCDTNICRRHAIDQPHASVRLDYCPPHDAVQKEQIWPSWTRRRDRALDTCLGTLLNGRPHTVFLKAEKDDALDPEPFMPNGFKECYGFCLTEHGNVYSFWFGWDGRQPAITEWTVADPKEQPWSRTLAYRQARERLGIGMVVVREQRRRRARRFVKIRR